jgi:hypothetical protein
MIDTKQLRGALGWLGILLPWIVLGLSLIFGYGIPDSISATYYFAPTITPFMIILGAAGILLICYRGYDKQDNIVCTITGISGLFICLFPCATSVFERVGTFQIPQSISGFIHNLSAIIFFLLLAYNSYFLFTKGSSNPTPNKLKRNKIFRICGVGMAASLICIIPVNIFDIRGGTWFVEAIALMFFGISWLTKSQVHKWLFKDK